MRVRLYLSGCVFLSHFEYNFLSFFGPKLQHINYLITVIRVDVSIIDSDIFETFTVCKHMIEPLLNNCRQRAKLKNASALINKRDAYIHKPCQCAPPLHQIMKILKFGGSLTYTSLCREGKDD